MCKQALRVSCKTLSLWMLQKPLNFLICEIAITLRQQSPGLNAKGSRNCRGSRDMFLCSIKFGPFFFFLFCYNFPFCLHIWLSSVHLTGRVFDDSFVKIAEEVSSDLWDVRCSCQNCNWTMKKSEMLNMGRCFVFERLSHVLLHFRNLFVHKVRVFTRSSCKKNDISFPYSTSKLSCLTIHNLIHCWISELTFTSLIAPILDDPPPKNSSHLVR